MEIKRARDILKSSSMITVMYEGSEIYIKAINEQNQTAVIHPVGQHDLNQEVPLSKLIER